MATLSSYPLDRNRGNGTVVLRLPVEDVQKVLSAKGPEFFTKARFILRGTLRPFKAELRTDDNGNKMIHHGKGRLQLSVRVEDLTPLDLGSDLVVQDLTVRVEQDGIWLMETTNTKWRNTRRHITKKQLALEEPPMLPAVIAPAADAESVKPNEVEELRERVVELEARLQSLEDALAAEPLPQASHSLVGDLLTLKVLFNQILGEHHAALIAVTIGNGQIEGIQVRPLDVTV